MGSGFLRHFHAVMLFSVEQLLELPEKPDLVCVKQDDTIRVAVKQMIENDFS